MFAITDIVNDTGIWITDIPGLPEHHLRYPDLLELIDVPDRDPACQHDVSATHPDIRDDLWRRSKALISDLQA